MRTREWITLGKDVLLVLSVRIVFIALSFNLILSLWGTTCRVGSSKFAEGFKVELAEKSSAKPAEAS